MKNKFKGYYKPSGEDLNKMWSDCVFVFDTNVLYDFYRYSEDTVDVMFRIFEELKGRIWIPHWIGLEYHRGLEERIKEQVEKYTSTIRDLSNFSEKIKTQREHPFLSAELQQEIQIFYDKFNKELTSQKKKLKDLIVENPVKEKVASLIGDNIGDALSKEEEQEVIKNGDERLPENIPPGFIDYKEKNKRPGLDKYGDYIIWFQILKEAKSKKKPFIFVTFDTKEDWYKLIKFNNSKILVGPRPELVEEFLAIENCLIWFYPTPDFIDNAVKHFNIEIEPTKLSKIKEETTKQILNEIDSNCISEIKNENESNEMIESNSIGGISSTSAEAPNSNGNV
jgi:predicted nucleic-acid-binding protein